MSDGPEPQADARNSPLQSARHRVWRWILAACLVGASVAALVVTAANLHQAMSDGDRPSCRLTNVWGVDASGRIARFLSTDEAAVMLQRTEETMGGKINPRYAIYRAAIVLDRTMNGQHRVRVRIPPDLDVKVGDDIFFKAGHRDETLPCNYVPNVVVGPSREVAP